MISAGAGSALLTHKCYTSITMLSYYDIWTPTSRCTSPTDASPWWLESALLEVVLVPVPRTEHALKPARIARASEVVPCIPQVYSPRAGL